ncbi:MAG: hypothetical protein HYY50_03370 [Candidatus Kerfeldbacteria bacterium]|nr:hypothetical protein [Candidatus Kerfeldbacteria bacterium]
MHLYFYAPPTNRRDLEESYSAIKTVLNQTDLWVSTNTEDQGIQVSAEVLAETRQSGVPLLERMDAFVIEGTTSDPEVGFLLAHAIALKKPTLYLYRRGTVPQVFNHLSQKELPATIKTVAYQPSAVSRVVSDFLQSITGLKIRQIPRHKFTLRITDAMEEYLHFRTHNTKKTKADFLREEIERLMEQDEDWRHHQRRRRSSTE